MSATKVISSTDHPQPVQLEKPSDFYGYVVLLDIFWLCLYACRYRLSEISFVLKAITTVIISMKKSTQTLGKVIILHCGMIINYVTVEDSAAWEQLISLYPYLVECTTTSSTQVSRPLREALLQFCDLLKPPGQTLKISNGNS